MPSDAARLEWPHDLQGLNPEWLCRTFLPHVSQQGAPSLELSAVLRVMSWATPRLRAQPNCVHIGSGTSADEEAADPCLVVGPLRGHLDVARILGAALVQNTTASVVFLGDYVDGGQASIEALCLALVTLLCLPEGRVAVLRGRHELTFPVSSRWGGGVEARLVENLRWRCAQYVGLGNFDDSTSAGRHPADIEAQLFDEISVLFRSVFAAMPLAAVVHGRFFCVSGGPTPSAPKIAMLQHIVRDAPLGHPGAGAVCDLVGSEPADEDEEALGAPEHFDYTRNSECGLGTVYSHHAARRFLKQNDLISIIRGSPMFLFSDPPLASAAGRPSYGRYSPYDPGYRLQRPTASEFPSTLSLFSAPRLAGTAQNLGAVAWITREAVSVIQFDADPPARFPQLPGDSNRLAFAWSLPLVIQHLGSVLRCMLSGEGEPVPTRSRIQQPLDDEHEESVFCNDLRGKLLRFRRLCRHARRMPQGLDLQALKRSMGSTVATPPQKPSSIVPD